MRFNYKEDSDIKPSANHYVYKHHNINKAKFTQQTYTTSTIRALDSIKKQ